MPFLHGDPHLSPTTPPFMVVPVPQRVTSKRPSDTNVPGDRIQRCLIPLGNLCRDFLGKLSPVASTIDGCRYKYLYSRAVPLIRHYLAVYHRGVCREVFGQSPPDTGQPTSGSGAGDSVYLAWYPCGLRSLHTDRWSLPFRSYRAIFLSRHISGRCWSGRSNNPGTYKWPY
jgi:hypothetical protein